MRERERVEWVGKKERERNPKVKSPSKGAEQRQKEMIT